MKQETVSQGSFYSQCLCINKGNVSENRKTLERRLLQVRQPTQWQINLKPSILHNSFSVLNRGFLKALPQFDLKKSTNKTKPNPTPKKCSRHLKEIIPQLCKTSFSQIYLNNWLYRIGSGLQKGTQRGIPLMVFHLTFSSRERKEKMTARLCRLLMALTSLFLSMAYVSAGSRRLISPRLLNPCNPQKSFRVIQISTAESLQIPAVIFCESLQAVSNAIFSPFGHCIPVWFQPRQVGLMKMAPELRKHTTLLLHGHHHSLFYATLVDLDFFLCHCFSYVENFL